MNMLKTYFPLSFKTKDVTELIISIAMYLITGVAVGIITFIIGIIPLIGGFIAGIIGTVSGLYILAGIILTILNFFKVLEK